MSAQNPQSLFKYLSFGERLLEQLCYKQVYYASPASFNDPLDCQPVVTADGGISNDALEQLLAEMIRRRSRKEIDVAMKKLTLQEEGDTARRNALVENEAKKTIGILGYEATNPEIVDQTGYHHDGLTRAIGHEMRKGYGTGLLCLSSKFDSPLMWSHYADQHRGVCIEYDVSKVKQGSLHKVFYDTARAVSANQLHDFFVSGNENTRSAIDTACLLTKSTEWRYESEWRILGPLGLRKSPGTLKSVIFGMRCTETLQYAIVKSMEDRYKLEGRGKVKLWEITKPSDGFKLKRKPIDPKVVRQRISAADDFEDLTVSDDQNEWPSAN